jgi:2-polyprenyl-6-methoxyphenol hydroxylase-like FAD-dependent oxidoreductase
MPGSGSAGPSYGTAVVIGASIAGSAAAAALAGNFEQVIVLDRDILPDSPSRRKGVPHGHQYHVLTVGGRQAFEDLLPGFTKEAVELGVPYVDAGADVQYGSKVGWFPRFDADLKVLMVSRQFLEWMIRRRVSALPSVKYAPRTRASGLVAVSGAVTGVRTVDEDGGPSEVIAADLVVDASGRSSRAPDWLEEIGYPRPVETTVNARWGYTTTYFRPREGWDPGFAAIYLGPTVSGDGLSKTRGGAFWVQEAGQWVLTAQGCASDYPPGDEAGMRDYLHSIGSPYFEDLLTDLELIAPVEAWRNTSNRFRDYAGLADRPERFVVLGDATAAFNPIYGQGMAVAAFAGRTLRDEIARFSAQAPTDGLEGFAESFQKSLTGVIKGAWEFSTGSDYNVPGVEIDGVPQPEANNNGAGAYADRVLALATEDLGVTKKFLETMQLLRTVEWMADESLRQRVTQDWDRLGKITRA